MFGRTTMKFLYIDVKKRKLVAVFQNATGVNFYWSKEEVENQKNKHVLLSSWDMIEQCKDAIDAFSDYKQQKPWWKFW